MNRRARTCGLLIVLFLAIGGTFVAPRAWARAGLLIVAHGAPSESWCKPVAELAGKVEDVLESNGPSPFPKVTVGFLEFAHPTVAEAIRELEDDGADTVFVLPLFVAPSAHTICDLPNVLGIAAHPHVLRQLRQEGAEVAHPRARVLVGPTLAYGSFLDRALTRQAQLLSTKPDSEAVVILAHGDPEFEPIWRQLGRRIGASICGGTGISWFDVAFIEAGQTFLQNGLPAIERAAENRSRVLVLNLFVNLTARKLAKRYSSQLHERGLEDGAPTVRYSDQPLVLDPDLPRWIATVAREMWAATHRTRRAAKE